MSKVKAISGATGKDFEALTAKAKEMGAKTKFSATESGQALEYMAMAGWKSEDMLNGLEGIMNLAAASGEDLAVTSDIVTDALTAFGMTASDSSHFADVLAQASVNANTNVGMLGESFKYVAPVAGAMKYSVEDISVALGLMANASIKGSMAGTSLKTAIANMASPTDTVAIAMKKYGISLTNADGSAKSFIEVIDNLRTNLGGLSETEQTAAASAIFGKEAMAGMLAIINASPQDYEKLTEAIYNADGAASKMAETMQDNLSGRITSMKSRLEGAAIVIGEILEPYASKLVSTITDVADAFIGMDKGSQRAIVAMMAIVAAIAPGLMLTSKLVSGFSSMIKTIAFIASPVGIALVAIAALAAGFAYLMSVNESFRGQVTSVWNAVGEKIRSVIDGIDFKVIKEKLDGFIQQIQNTAASINFDAIAEKVQGIVSFLSNIFSGLNLPVAAFVGGFIGILAKFSGPLSTFSSQVLTVGSVITKGIGSAVPKVIPAITNFFNVLWSRGGVIGLLKNGISGLGKAFAGLLSPATLIMGAIALLAAGFVTLMATNENFRNTVIDLGSNILSALIPAFQMIGQAFGQIASTVLPVFISLFNQLLPIIGQIITVVLQVAAALAPMITQLVGALLPVITNIITVVMNIVTAVMPAVIAIINVIMSVIQTVAPIIMDILSVVISVVSGIISAISPIVSFIGGIIVSIMGVISPIITWIANAIATIIQVIGTITGAVSGIFSTVFSIISGIFSAIVNFISTAINAIGSVISALTGIVGGVFNGIYSIASSIMGNVRNFIIGVFNGIKSAWNGLTAFVSGVFSGIGSAVNALVGQVKGFVNGVIGGINAAIGLINKIPGVSIGKIPYLLHGTNDWQGGFARMNEGGRGELTYLPDGSRVIPHDISVRYAKEAARSTAYREPIDMSGILEGMTIKIVNNTNVDGTPLREACSSYVIEKIGRQQRAVLRARGAY